jgi:ketosteroid isomerase-like protein
MPKSIAIAILFFLVAPLSPRPTALAPDAVSEIRAVLDAQTAAWNRGDIDSFMSGYWKSDETEFIGSGGITRGWQSVLDRYRRSYPDAKAMGQLSFGNLEIHVTCPDAAYVIGEFHLIREKDSPSGVFTLNFKKFPEGWRIVADHTTAYPAPAPSK